MYKIVTASLLLAASLSGNTQAADLNKCPRALTASYTSGDYAPPHNEGFKYEAWDADKHRWSGAQFISASDDFIAHGLRPITISSTEDRCEYAAPPQEDYQGNVVYERRLTMTKDR